MAENVVKNAVKNSSLMLLEDNSIQLDLSLKICKNLRIHCRFYRIVVGFDPMDYQSKRLPTEIHFGMV